MLYEIYEIHMPKLTFTKEKTPDLFETLKGLHNLIIVEKTKYNSENNK